MNKTELITKLLNDMGYHPILMENGSIDFRFQMKHVCVDVGDDEESYVCLVLPCIYEVEEGREVLILATCNCLVRDIKLAKFYIDRAHKYVNASFEFYYTDEETLKINFEKSLRIISIARNLFSKTISELSEDESD